MTSDELIQLANENILAFYGAPVKICHTISDAIRALDILGEHNTGPPYTYNKVIGNTKYKIKVY